MLLLVVAGEAMLESMEASSVNKRKGRGHTVQLPTAAHLDGSTTSDVPPPTQGEAEVIIDGAHPDPLGI